jgi:biofilm PGA synthesis N-glycosyltransferase PgaC
MPDELMIPSAILFGLGLSGILAVFVIYPLFLQAAALVARGGSRGADGPWPSASMIVAVRNGERWIEGKIENSLSLDYPEGRFELVVVSDGSTDRTASILESCRDPRVKTIASDRHLGKARAIDLGVPECSGEVLIFSDADACLEKDALRKLLRHYGDPRIGGVCGLRVLPGKDGGLKKAQSRYIKFDSRIKVLESRAGSVTSNDGKLYSIRRDLYRPIEASATDDLFSCLSVVRQGHRFIFDGEARAIVRVPSRDRAHEIQRRRRIVCRSLMGIFSMADLLSPFRHGVFAVGLLINKVVRRFLPVCLILLFVGSILLAFSYPPLLSLVALQVLFYGTALAYPILLRRPGSRLGQAAALPFYFCVGNYGTLLGLLDFLRGRRVTGWDPAQGDRPPAPVEAPASGSPEGFDLSGRTR